MWQRLIPAAKAMCIGLWIFSHLMSADVAYVATAPVVKRPMLATLYGHYTLTAMEKYRGSLTTPDQIRLKFETGLTLLNDRFVIGPETWHNPRYRLQSHPVIFSEGDVPQDRWSNFFGYGMERESINVLEIRQTDLHPNPKQYKLEVICEDEIWLLYDGWLLRFERKTRAFRHN